MKAEGWCRRVGHGSRCRAAWAVTPATFQPNKNREKKVLVLVPHLSVGIIRRRVSPRSSNQNPSSIHPTPTPRRRTPLHTRRRRRHHHSAQESLPNPSFSQTVPAVLCKRRWRWQSPWRASMRGRGSSGWTSPLSIWTPSPSRPARTSASSGRRTRRLTSGPNQ